MNQTEMKLAKFGRQLNDKANLIYENTLTSSVSSITVDKDLNNNSFSLKNVKILIKVPANSIANNSVIPLLGRINNIATTVYNSTAAGISTSLFYGNIRNIHSTVKVNLDVVSGSIMMDGSVVSKGYDSTGAAFVYNRDAFTGQTIEGTTISNIASIMVYGTTFPVGTYIKIVGDKI